MEIKGVEAKIILDSRKDETIEILIKTSLGVFSASSPSGKSKGKYEVKLYKTNIQGDINIINDLQAEIAELKIDSFQDLEKLEVLIRNKIGANSLFALESAILKALALEQDKALWQVINPYAKNMPYPIGNCIGGGMHTKSLNYTKPDFQEFLVIPKTWNFADNIFLMNKARDLCRERLKIKKSLGENGDESELSTGLTNEEVLEILDKTREELVSTTENEIEIGIDVAASTFFTPVGYRYKNPPNLLKKDEQKDYIKNLIEKFRIGYVEDPFNEDEFDKFAELRNDTKKERTCFIVGDDLTASRLERFKKALLKGSVNAIIVKPNQSGSLIEAKKLVDLAKKYDITTIMSHRSGETLDYALADLAFGFSCDFIKTGIIGREREIKLKRLLEIEKSL